MEKSFAEMHRIPPVLRTLSSYLLLGLLVPGGSVLALWHWLYQHSHKAV